LGGGHVAAERLKLVLGFAQRGIHAIKQVGRAVAQACSIENQVGRWIGKRGRHAQVRGEMGRELRRHAQEVRISVIARRYRND
jgi:hypothetical protein